MATTHWECGFEAGDWAYYALQGWTRVNTVSVITSARAHQSLSGNGGTYCLFSEDTTTSPVFGTGGKWLHFWMGYYSPNSLRLAFYKASSLTASVYFYSNGTVFINAAGTSTYSDVGWNPYQDHWIAIEAVIQDTGGQITVKIDGVQVVQATGDTQSASTSGWDQIAFLLTDHRKYIDDIIITTDDELPERFIPAIVPNENSTPLELTPSSGTNWENVSQLPVTATTPYNQATAANQEDNYGYGTIGWTPDTIDFVSVNAGVAGDGTITQAELRCNANLSGSAHTLTGTLTWEAFLDIWGTDPSDSNAWTKAKIDSLTAGIEFK